MDPEQSGRSEALKMANENLSLGVFREIRSRIRRAVDTVLNKTAALIPDSLVQKTPIYREAQALAKIDPVTGLPNRVAMKDKEKEVLARFKRVISRKYNESYSEHGESYAIIFIDLDDLKFVNDHYGHDKGDALLRDTATAMLTRIREEEQNNLFRWGGDEFLGVFTLNKRTFPEDVYAAFKIAEALREKVAHDTGRTISLGIKILDSKYWVQELFEGETVTFESLVKFADTALHEAKERGRNRICLFEDDIRRLPITLQHPARLGNLDEAMLEETFRERPFN